MAFAGLANGIKGLSWKEPASYAIGIGIAGLLLLLALITGGLYNALYRQPDPACAIETLTPIEPISSTSGIEITGILPSDIERNHTVCIGVANVVPKAKVDVVTAELKLAASTTAQINTQYGAAASTLTKAPNPQTQANAVTADAALTKATADQANAQAAVDDLKKPRTIILYLNGKASPMTASARPIAAPQALTFSISTPEDANDASAAFWRDLLSRPVIDGKIPLRMSVAVQGDPAPASDWTNTKRSEKSQPITFLLYKPLMMRLAEASVLAIFIGFVGLAKKTTLLRTGSSTNNAYSLSLAQMALWLFLTTTGFIYIWLVTGQYLDVFTSGLFVLVGISGATATVAQAMDGSQGTANTTNGFVCDIAGKWIGGEVQLQRVQIIAWTLILASIFCWNVIFKIVLTSFDTNLLVLAGIANGVYVSLKPQETNQLKNAPPPPPDTVGTPAGLADGPTK